MWPIVEQLSILYQISINLIPSINTNAWPTFRHRAPSIQGLSEKAKVTPTAPAKRSSSSLRQSPLLTFRRRLANVRWGGLGRAKEYNPSLDEEGSGPKSGLTQRSASSSSNIMFGSTPFQQALRSLVWFRASDCNWFPKSHLKVVRSTRTGEIQICPRGAIGSAHDS